MSEFQILVELMRLIVLDAFLIADSIIRDIYCLPFSLSDQATSSRFIAAQLMTK